ncbi:uncharacterized protein TNCV_2427921 [Trichonephila clavipes]|nr:uncharacterized protein TNCV_2427921 [Trichonephila clavipes]
MLAAEWNEVVFTDESRICLQHHDGRIRVCRHCGERMLESCVMHLHTGHAPGIMVCGGIGYPSCTTLVRIAGTLKSPATSPRCWSQLSFPIFRAWSQPYFNRIMTRGTFCPKALRQSPDLFASLAGSLFGSFADRKHVVHGCSTIDPDYTPSCPTRSILATRGSCLISCTPRTHPKSF